jgi:hypothetical protein
MPRPSHSQWGREIYFKGPGPGPGPGEERRHARHGILASACATSRVVVLDPIHSFPADRAGITHHLRSAHFLHIARSRLSFARTHLMCVGVGLETDGRTKLPCLASCSCMRTCLSRPRARPAGRPSPPMRNCPSASGVSSRVSTNQPCVRAGFDRPFTSGGGAGLA